MKSNLHTTRIAVFTTITAVIIGSFLYYRYVVPYHIGMKEQIQLFVFESTYIESYFSKPASLSCLIGDFLTQFLYFKTAGALVITFLLGVQWWLIYLILKRFSIKRYALLWSLIPVIIEGILIPHPSFSVALPVSFIIALSAFILYSYIGRKIALIIGIILVPILYRFAGVSVFLFVILVVLFEIKGKKDRVKDEGYRVKGIYVLTLYLLTFILFSLALPYLFRHHYLLTSKQAYFYPYPDMNEKLSLTGIMDKTQENLFGMTIESYHNNWGKVMEIAEKSQMKNSIAAYYTNLALSHTGILGERLMDFYQPFSSGLLFPNLPGTGWFPVFVSNDAYFHIGDIERAQHAAMLGMTFSPRQRSARLAERLVEINLVMGDTAAATKYIRILESTMFHKIKPERLKNLPQRIKFNKDFICNAADVKTSLELLTESDPNNFPAVNYLLCFYLLHKDIPAFFKAYTSYYKGKFTPIPKVYSEALLIYLAVTKSSVKELASYDIDSEIIKKFGEYTRLYEKSNGILTPMQKNFPNTYWLYYHFAVMNK